MQLFVRDASRGQRPHAPPQADEGFR